MSNESAHDKNIDRRAFMATSAIAAGTAAGLMAMQTPSAFAAPKRNIIKSLKFGMVTSPFSSLNFRRKCVIIRCWRV